ncbi:hypothetical protein [Flavobacterium sp. Root420]|uniref:hypothetical protein n=1 Tax=Flavobacterium sp. Root420 TaxID=1736533 RepID=UPI0006F6A485|nr:hypothetical protein [Flavobacterium sp. Root420]KQX00875.1 hypothetical protein ASC72_08435 [Flavobacterium sp. Root420]
MGVYTYIEVYKKDMSYIKSVNSILGIFQVDFEAKEKFRISDNSKSFYGGIRSLDKLKNVDLGYTYEIYEDYLNLFMFYVLANGDYGESATEVNGKIESLLFDPSRVIKGIDTLLQIIKYFEQEDLDELQKYGEIENLNELRDILKMAAEEDSLIGCKTA